MYCLYKGYRRVSPLDCFKGLKKMELQMGTDCKYDMIEMIGIRISLWLAPKHFISCMYKYIH